MTMLLTVSGATDLSESQAQPADITTKPSSGTTYWALIDRSDDALLDFNTEALEHDIEHARALLAEHPTAYRSQLTIAKFIDGWIARITNDAKPCRFNEGFVQALVEMTWHLRDGDFAVDSDDDVTCDCSRKRSKSHS